MTPVYKRVLLKISGEALAGDNKFGLNWEVIGSVTDKIKQCAEMGIQIGIVVGGGNFWRGRQGPHMERSRADHVGMLATMMNALVLQDALERAGVPTRVQSAIEMRAISEPYIRGRAISHLEKGRVVIFACGTGNPFFSTDTAAALRAAEIDADIILLAKKVDGIYSADPEVDKNAIKFEKINYNEVLEKRLGVMDSTAASMCMDNSIPILVFGLGDGSGIIDAVIGKKIGTLVKEDK
jgi:uridylate kinase